MHCIICTDRFDSAVGISSTQCGHVFHSKCLLKWIDCSKTCPECRGPVSSKNISKLYFNILPSDDFDAAHLENHMQNLNAKLKEKDMELESSKKKIKELQLHAAGLEKVVELNHQNILGLQFEVSKAKDRLKSLTNLETKAQRLKQENENISKEMEHYINIKTIVSGCQKDVDEILREMQSEVATEIGNVAASRLATHCSVLKRELRRVIEEKNQLRNEVTDIKKRLGLTTASLQNSERKVKKLEEQLKRSDEMNNSLLVQNRALLPNSNSSMSEEISPNNSSTSSKENAKVNDELTISFDAPSMKKIRMEIVVLDKKVEKMSVPMLPTSSVLPFPLTVTKNHTDEGSVLRTGYNGLGGHDRVVLGTEKGKYKMHPKFRVKKK